MKHDTRLFGFSPRCGFSLQLPVGQCGRFISRGWVAERVSIATISAISIIDQVISTVETPVQVSF